MGVTAGVGSLIGSMGLAVMNRRIVLAARPQGAADPHVLIAENHDRTANGKTL